MSEQGEAFKRLREAAAAGVAAMQQLIDVMTQLTEAVAKRERLDREAEGQ